MANEYLRRTPTSTGNRRVWTASLWYKMSSAGAFFGAGDGSTAGNSSHWWFNSDQLGYSNNDGTNYVTVLRKSRDFSSWSHYMLVVDTTKVEPYDRVVFYENGVRNEVDTTSGYTNPSRNAELSWINQLWSHHIGARNRAGANTFSTGEYCDFFFIDGQALTPDVFGFYKQGKGYISAGSTQATDFRPGQWVPKTPRVIKTEIIRRGGFGVNGFYLPMNDSKNFGADFHCDPNSIITLNEKLPQPRVGVASTAVGIGYTDALRADPYAANLVLAIPGVIGGQGSGYGDYSANIKGSGTNKTVTANGNAGVAVTASYYGSALSFDGSGDYLSIPSSSDFAFGTDDFTIDFWMNLNATTDCHIWEGRDGTNVNQLLIRLSSGIIRYYGNGADRIVGTALNTSQWNHIAVSRNNTTSQLFVNGVCVGINTVDTINYVSAASTVFIGTNESTNSRFLNGFIQDLRIYKGVAKYTGGFDVPRPYTPVGIATWRAVPDTTANNFATMNPLRTGGYATLDNGNLRSTGNTAANSSPALSTFNVKSGKWYWELRADTVYSGGAPRWPSPGVTVLQSNWTPLNAEVHIASYGVGVRGTSTGTASVIGISGNTTVSSVTSANLTAGDVYMCAMDADNGAIYFGLNGTWYNSGSPTSAGSKTGSLFNYTPSTDNYELSPTTINYNGSIGSANFGQNPTFSGNTTAGTFTDSNGKGLFKYQPPTGFLALCEDNLPTPAISNPGQYFKTVLWTGDGASRSIVGVGFTTDFVWIKGRTQVSNSFLFDSIRGATNRICSSLTNAEASEPTTLTSFSSDGFSLGTDAGVGACNVSGQNYVAWCWRAGAGTTSTNTNGSITSVVSVNQDAGFSIVSFTGTGASGATVGHGLGRKPAFIISKSRDNGTYAWHCWHKGLGTDYYINLNSTGAQDNSVNIFPSAGITSTVYQTATSALKYNNFANERYIVYCWTEIEGFSKFGSYVGNGSADGPFVYTGGKPAFVMIKRIDGSGGWSINDSSRNSTNPVNLFVNAESSAIEGTAIIPDFLSNGFKIRDSANQNASGATYIYACWMESPFQTANSK
jgi:hypothetical protein